MGRRLYQDNYWAPIRLTEKPKAPQYPIITGEYFNTDDIVIYTHQGYMSDDGYVPPEAELAQILGGFGAMTWRSLEMMQEANDIRAVHCREMYDIKIIRNGKILTSIGQDKLQVADARDIVKQKTFDKEKRNG